MIRLLIVAEIRLYCESLTEVFKSTSTIHVVGTASCRLESLDLVRKRAPHVVLVDMAMPESLFAVRTIIQQNPRINVVALGVAEVDDDIIACVEAGVGSYIPRDGSIADLVSAIDSAVRGELRCSPRIAHCLMRRVQWLARHGAVKPPLTRLTAREIEITGLLDCGMSNKEIARSLRIEVSTVKNHVHNILDKLHVQSRSQAAFVLRSHHSSGTFARHTARRASIPELSARAQI